MKRLAIRLLIGVTLGCVLGTILFAKEGGPMKEYLGALAFTAVTGFCCAFVSWLTEDLFSRHPYVNLLFVEPLLVGITPILVSAVACCIMWGDESRPTDPMAVALLIVFVLLLCGWAFIIIFVKNCIRLAMKGGKQERDDESDSR